MMQRSITMGPSVLSQPRASYLRHFDGFRQLVRHQLQNTLKIIDLEVDGQRVTVDAYRVPSPAARAATQLEATGKRFRPGQRVRFLYTRDATGVRAWDLPGAPDPAGVDVARYTELLIRAAGTIVQPLGVDETTLHEWVHQNAHQLKLPL